MTYKQSLIEAICKHPAVSRAMVSAKDTTPALDILVRLRRARRDAKRTLANMREEAQAGIGPESGGAVGPSWPGPRLLCEAAHTTGLPDDLKELVILALDQKA